MGEMMDANFGDQMERRVGDLLNRIPGYRGYRVKEDRRDADRRLREHLATVYGQHADRIEQVGRDLATQRRLNEIGPVDDFASKLRHFTDRVRTATYGYGGLMGDRDVGSAALDQLHQFDQSLASGVDELNGPIADLEAALAAQGDLAAPARAGKAVVNDLLARFDQRGEVVETGEAASRESVMRVLAPTSQPATSAAYDLQAGDALSILGDDFIVDAAIAVNGEPASFRLFRLGTGDDAQWLFASNRAEDGLALLTATDTAPPVGGATAIDGANSTPRLSGSGDGEVVGAGGASGLRPVRYDYLGRGDDPAARALVLDWGAERQAFTGREVVPNDVEIFGRPSATLN